MYFLFLNFSSSRHYSSADIIVLCYKNHIYSIIYTDIMRIRIINLENVIIAFFIRKELTYPSKPTCELRYVIPFLVAPIFQDVRTKSSLVKGPKLFGPFITGTKTILFKLLFCSTNQIPTVFSGQDGRAV